MELALLHLYPALAHGAELYHYNHPDFYGIPSWIVWVYACGAPAAVSYTHLTLPPILLV